MSEISFSTGQIFGYWPHWKEDKKKPEHNTYYGQNNIDIFNGYSKSELFIIPFYSSLKQEIFSSGFINIKEWLQHLYKAQQYLQTQKVKNMIQNTWTEMYGIKEGEPISLQHILCIILYCDTDDLQNNFSSTFRKNTVFETLYSLKKRHQKYYHFAKHIVEAIKVWGINRDYDKEHGPFYCGLSQVLNIGEFNIYLKSITSTSKDIEVAINFAKRDGCILQIDNDIGIGQKMFDCSFISNYSEENERLWIGYENM